MNRYHWLLFLAPLILFPACQGEQYEAIILRAQVEELERKLEALSRTPAPADVEGLRKRLNAAESELIRVQQQLTTLSEQPRAVAPASDNDVAAAGDPAPAVLELPVAPPGDSEPAPETTFDESELATALDDSGATVVRNDAGQIVEVYATEFPLEAETVSSLSQLPELKSLSVSGPWVTEEMFDAIGTLGSLQRLELDLTIANTAMLEKLQGLTELRYIQLFRTDIDDDSLAVLAAFPKLEQIRCGQTRVGDPGLQHLKSMTSLRAIDLSDCNRVSSAGVAALAGLPNLKFLKVWGPQIDDAAMDSASRMKSLEVLGLNDTRVTDDGLERLAGHPALKEIHLARTRAGDRSMLVISQMPSITTLRLRDTQLSDTGIGYLANASGIIQLDLSENNSPGITNAGMQHLAKLDGLRELNLWTTKVGDEGVARLTGLADLTWLNLDKTQITDEACKSLAQMPQLEWLHLGSNGLTDACVPELLKLTSLRYLNVSHTGISRDAGRQLQEALAARGGVVVGP